MDKHLHIISLDIPFPVAHGGHTDLFYKLKALHEQGVIIHLHCFTKKRIQVEPVLNTYCASVHYYRRKTGIAGLSLSLPYIVKSRTNTRLAKELLKDDHPILMEGIHCTSILSHNAFINRKLLVRLHNIEHTYYHSLAQNEKNIFKRLFYSMESRLLKKYERAVSQKAKFIAVSEEDSLNFRKLFQADVSYLPVFIPYTDIRSLSGKGSYCLYHGNLSISENESAAMWLLDIVRGTRVQLIIAGKAPSTYLQHSIRSSDASLTADPSDEQMQELIANAQIHILPSFNNTGIKLKLLNALFNGRYCVVNEKGIAGTGLNRLCILAETPDQFRKAIATLCEKEFTADDIRLRKEILLAIFNNRKNAETLMTLIW